MRFYTTDWNAKRHAKRLKEVLSRYGHDVSYTSCLDLMARLYGFANFAEMKRMAADQPLSTFDDDVDDGILEIRFQYEVCVMVETGFADIAGAVLDEVNPTSLRSGPTAGFDDGGSVDTELPIDDVSRRVRVRLCMTQQV
ncbi:hypothetical protein [Tardiphaga sp.]|uniref:hypothetical protein n=1 Tax=Tardiphaga sp. TaxID=1926292 RepID=UPI00352A6CEC